MQIGLGLNQLNLVLDIAPAQLGRYMCNDYCRYSYVENCCYFLYKKYAVASLLNLPDVPIFIKTSFLLKINRFFINTNERLRRPRGRVLRDDVLLLPNQYTKPLIK